MLNKNIDLFYEANYIQRFKGLTIFEKFSKTSIFTYLDYKSKVNGSNYYGKLELNSMGIKVKWLDEVVCNNNPNYAFFTVKVNRHNRDFFIMIMRNLKHHMYMENDKLYFDIMNKYLVHKWYIGDFIDDPDTNNIQRINTSLKACGILKESVLNNVPSL